MPAETENEGDGPFQSIPVTDLYYSNRSQVVEEDQSGMTISQNVWSPFYVNSLIERDEGKISPDYASLVAQPGAYYSYTDGSGNQHVVEQNPSYFDVVVGTGDDVLVTASVGSDGSLFALVFDPDLSNYSIYKFNSDGSPDTAFGSGSGYKTLHDGTYVSMTSDSSGDIFAFGTDVDGDPLAVALNSSGSFLYQLYGDSYAAFLSSFSPSAYGVSAYGDPVVAGSAGDANEVVELLSDGELNTSFGSSGVVTLPFYPTSVTVMDHGQLYVGGSADGIPGILVRLNPDGSLDTTFGLNGYAVGVVPDEAGGTVNDNGSQRLYAEQDADYNLTSLTDASGDVVERYSYDPYGNVTVMNASGGVLGNSFASSAYGNTIGFQGMQIDAATGMYVDRNGATYSPSLGRFETEDPTGANYVNGADLYPIEMDNPVDSVDPTGMSAQSADGLIQLSMGNGATAWLTPQQVSAFSAAQKAAQAQQQLNAAYRNLGNLLESDRNQCSQDAITQTTRARVQTLQAALAAAQQNLTNAQNAYANQFGNVDTGFMAAGGDAFSFYGGGTGLNAALIAVGSLNHLGPDAGLSSELMPIAIATAPFIGVLDLGAGELGGCAGNAAESAENTYVIGRQADTAAYAGKAGFTQLNDPAWTLAKNDAWIQSAINSRSPVLLASDPTVNTFFDFTSKYFGTVTGREVDQLMSAGYKFVIQDGKQMLLPP